MGFIRDLFTTGGAGAGEAAASPRNQNPWRGVFNPGSPQWRSAKGSAREVDKPESAPQAGGGGAGAAPSVMDEIVRAPSVEQAKGSTPAGVVGVGGGGAPTSPSAARTQASPREFAGMDASA
jgi:hypothetical protein